MTATADANGSAPEDREPAVDDERSVPSRSHRGLVHALVVLGAVVMLIAGVSTWVKRQALDTDAWVDVTDELLADPDIRAAISQFVVDELYQSVDIPAQIRERLPENLQGLAGPLAAAVQQSATEVVERLLASDAFDTIWEAQNRRAHEVLVRILRDETTDAVSTDDGAVTLDLGEVVRNLASRLGLPQTAIDRIPADTGEVTLVRSDSLAAAQAAVTAVEWASVLLFLLVIALFVAAVVLARGWRRVALRNVGLSVVVVGLVLLVVQRLVGRYIVDDYVELEDNRDVAAAVWAIGTALLRDIGRNSVAVGTVVFLVAALAGPGRVAVRIRRVIAPLFTGNLVLLWGLAAAGYLLLVLWSPLPSLATWWGALIGAVLVALAVESLRRICERDEEAAPIGEDPSGRDAGAPPLGDARQPRPSGEVVG